MKLLFSLIVLLPVLVQAADPLAGRTFTWNGNVGISGGIPYRSTIYTNFYHSNTVTAINSGIQNCPSNQVVFLNAGTYTNLASGIQLTKSGVTLRGAGSSNTVLTTPTSSEVIYVGASYGGFDTPVTAQHVSITAGLTQGSTSLTVASTNLAGSAHSIPVGRIAFIDQNNDTNTGAVGNNGGACTGCYTSLGDPGVGRDRYKNQNVKIVAVSGNTVTIDPPIHATDWDSALLPQLWWGNDQPVEMASVEDLGVDIAGEVTFSGIIELQNTYSCWVSNTATYGGNRHIYYNIGVRGEVRHCYLGDGGGEDTYGIALYHMTGALIEDNILNGVQDPGYRGIGIIGIGMNGCAVMYNYHTNYGGNLGQWQYPYTIQFHGNHPTWNLSEGNVGYGWTPDNTWGSSSHNISFRDRLRGWEESQSQAQNLLNNVCAVIVSATNRFCSVVGSVLGTESKNTVYEISNDCDVSGGIGQYSRVYYIGGRLAFCSETAGNYDAMTSNTLVRAWNWDSATSTNSGIVYGGFTSNDVPNSLYYSSIPANFGILTWPPIAPNNKDLANARTNIPANYRFSFGTNPPAASGGGEGNGITVSPAQGARGPVRNN